MTFAEHIAKAIGIIVFGITIAPLIVAAINPNLEEPAE